MHWFAFCFYLYISFIKLRVFLTYLYLWHILKKVYSFIFTRYKQIDDLFLLTEISFSSLYILKKSINSQINNTEIFESFKISWYFGFFEAFEAFGAFKTFINFKTFGAFRVFGIFGILSLLVVNISHLFIWCY